MFSKPVIDDIVYHPGYNCQLTCRGCVNFSNHLESRNIPDETNWERDLTILFERFTVNHIDIAGGETLMFPHLQELVELLKPAKSFTITTNGLLLHKNMWLKDLLDNDPRLTIVLSLQGNPMLESVYINRVCESLGIFLNKSSSSIKNHFRRHFVSHLPDKGLRIGMLHERIRYKNHHKDLWAYPLLDENEIPVQFNNTKENAYSKCICPTPHIKDGKVYKCPLTATLPKVLEAKNLYDSRWDHLKNYKPYDLLSPHNPDLWDPLLVPEEVCTKCPFAAHEWDHNKTDIHTKIVFGNSVLK